MIQRFHEIVRWDEVVPRPEYDDRLNLSGYQGRGATSSQRARRPCGTSLHP